MALVLGRYLVYRNPQGGGDTNASKNASKGLVVVSYFEPKTYNTLGSHLGKPGRILLVLVLLLLPLVTACHGLFLLSLLHIPRSIYHTQNRCQLALAFFRRFLRRPASSSVHALSFVCSIVRRGKMYKLHI